MVRALLAVGVLVAAFAPKGAPSASKAAGAAPKSGVAPPKSNVAPKGTPPKAPPFKAKPRPAAAKAAVPAPSASPAPDAPIPSASALPSSAPSAAPSAAPAVVASAAPVREAPPASLIVDVRPVDGAPPWFAAGLEEVIVTEFGRFRGLALKKKLAPEACPDDSDRCRVDGYRAAGVEVMVLGRVEPRGVLTYAVYETWSNRRVHDGQLKVAGITTPTLQRLVGDIVRPIVQGGGLLEQRPSGLAEREIAPPPPTAAPLPNHWILGVAVGAIVFVALPILFAFALVGGRILSRRATPKSWKWSAALLVLLSASVVAVAVVDVPALFRRAVAHAPPALSLAPPLVAGMLWGAFALALGATLFAPLRGLERLRHDALWPVLRAWSLLTLLRAAAMALLYGPAFAITLRTCAGTALSPRLTWAFVVPTVGLLVHFWWLSLVDNLTLYLDVNLTTGSPSMRNPWHATVKRYFQGYLRRNVVDYDEKTFERTLFLTGVRADVVCYGGGFAVPRIVVGERPLETALGELPDEEEIPERTVNADEFPIGFIAPSMKPPALKPADEFGPLQKAEQLRLDLGRMPARPRASMPRLLGESATLLGWILPQAAPDGVPLISDTEQDFGVVKILLSEHYSVFEGILDDEIDDTDPSQKDFLFGALLRELGVVVRRDVAFATLGLALGVLTARAGFFAKTGRLPLAFYARFLSLPAAHVGDAYAALNGGLHPLIQYLALLRGKGRELLTARANVPRLLATSRALGATPEADEPTAEELHAFRATPRGRATWLLRIFHGSAGYEPIRWARVLIAVMAFALAGVFLARSVSGAIAYHPTYVERIQSQAKKPPAAGDTSR